MTKACSSRFIKKGNYRISIEKSIKNVKIKLELKTNIISVKKIIKKQANIKVNTNSDVVVQ